MYCPQCGTQVSEDTAFCPKCGFKVAERVRLMQGRPTYTQGSQARAAVSSAAGKASHYASAAKHVAADAAQNVASSISSGTASVPFLIVDVVLFLIITFAPMIYGISTSYGWKFTSLPGLAIQCFRFIGDIRPYADTVDYLSTGFGLNSSGGGNLLGQLMWALRIAGVISIALWVFEITRIVSDARKDLKGEIAKDKAGTGLLIVCILVCVMLIFAQSTVAHAIYKLGLPSVSGSLYKKAMFPGEFMLGYIIVALVVRKWRNDRYKAAVSR